MKMMRKNSSWMIVAAALMIAGTVYAARSIEADEPAPTPSVTEESAPTRGPRIASGPHGDGPDIQIPRVEGRMVSIVHHQEYGGIVCEQDANVVVSMDGRVTKVSEQYETGRAPVEVGEKVEGFHEMNALLLENPWLNPDGADNILDLPRNEKYREEGALPGAVYRDEDGTLRWGCETWSPSGELPSVEERQRALFDKLEASGCENPFCR